MKNNLFATTIIYLWCGSIFAQIGTKIPSQNTGIIGLWINKDFGYDMKLQLSDKGKGVFEDEAVTYNIAGSKINIKFKTETIPYSFKLTPHSLTLSGGDLDAPITFTRNGTQPSSQGNNIETKTQKNDATQKSTKADKLIGKWTTEGADIEFKANGKGVYNGNPFTYTVNGNTLISADNSGTNSFFFMFLGESLSMSGAGVNVVLTRGHAGYKSETTTQGDINSGYSGGGGIDQSIVGKWCWVSSSGNYSASSSYSKCLNIGGNGTYTYSSEGSISGYGGGYYGGSSSQSSDSGTWKIVGNKIHVQSRSEGFKIYSFEKRNHPKNGDPMIIIDGDSYVTYNKRPSWR
jgi:hypothetical protein